MVVYISVCAAISPNLLQEAPYFVDEIKELAGKWNLHCTWANVKDVKTCWVNGSLQGINSLHEHLVHIYEAKRKEIVSRIEGATEERKPCVTLTTMVTRQKTNKTYAHNQGSQNDEPEDNDDGYDDIPATSSPSNAEMQVTGGAIRDDSYIGLTSNNINQDLLSNYIDHPDNNSSTKPNNESTVPVLDMSIVKSEFELCEEGAGSVVNSGSDYIQLPLTDIHRYRQKCDFCEAVFEKSRDFQQHVITIHTLADDKRKCPICLFQTVDRYALSFHLAAKHWRLKYQCPACGRSFTTTKQLEVHRCASGNEIENTYISLGQDVKDALQLPWTKFAPHYIKKDGILHCKYCSSKTKSPKEFKIHLSRKHVKKRLPCPKCGTKWGNRFDLKKHLKAVHSKSAHECTICNMSFNTKGRLAVHKRKHAEEKTLLCDKCHLSFASVQRLMAHVKRAHQESSADANEAVGSSALLTIDDIELHSSVENGIFCCNYCGHKTEYRNTIINHLKRRHMEKTVPCPMCDAKFAIKKDLKRHIASKHGSKPAKDPVTCHICSQTYASKLTLKSHMKSQHEDGVVEIQCDECGKIFHSSFGLKGHKERAHTRGPKPFICGHCGKGFLQNCHLTDHLQTHTEKPMFQCDVCHKEFYRKKLLLAHAKLHENTELRYQCQVCGKLFSSRPAYQIHEKRHSWKREHECSECGKSFFQKYHLDRHKIIHTGERPFVCSVCFKDFNDMSTLKKHSQIHLKLD